MATIKQAIAFRRQARRRGIRLEMSDTALCECLDAADAVLWQPAEEADPALEGRLALRWEGHGMPVEPCVVPAGYSRESRHCGGVQFRPMPESPKV